MCLVAVYYYIVFGMYEEVQTDGLLLESSKNKHCAEHLNNQFHLVLIERFKLVEFYFIQTQMLENGLTTLLRV